MSEVSTIPVTWQSRDHPLAAVAVAARGHAAIALARRLLELDAESLASLKGVSGDEFIIVIGDEESLPWVDGVIYLGRDSKAPSLLIPTTLTTSIPLALLERALAARFPAMLPLAVLADVAIVVPLGSARRVAAASVRQWVETHGEI